MFDATQAKIKNRNSTKNTTNKYNYLLKGLIKCKCCNAPMFGHKRASSQDNAYKCLDSKRYHIKGCTNRSINIDFAEEQIIKELMLLPQTLQTYFKRSNTSVLVKQKTDSIQKITIQKIDVEKRIDKLIDLNLDGKINQAIFDKKMTELNTELNSATAKYNTSINSFKQIDQKQLYIDAVTTLTNKLNKKDFAEKNTVVHTLIESIYVSWDESKNQNNLEIKFKIDELSNYLINSKVVVPRKRQHWIDKENVFSSQLIIEKIV